MNRIYVLIAALIFSFQFCYSQPLVANNDGDTIVGEGVRFERGLNWAQVLAKAKADNKLVFVDVFASWCGPCKMMDRDVYANVKIGDEVNSEFISIKVQADSSNLDDAEVRSWYPTAHQLTSAYKVTGYPCFLFFDGDGHLVDEDLGYRKVPDFILLLQEAKEFGKHSYNQVLSAYHQGVKNYPTMDKLALYVKKVSHNNMLADSIAKDYIESYLNRLPAPQLLTKDRLDFVNRFSKYITTRDGIFALCYNEPDTVDKIRKDKGWSKWLVENVIGRDELTNRFLIEGHPIKKNLNWEDALASISKSYPKIDARLLLLKYKINYYRGVDCDWKEWAKCTGEMINLYPPVANQGLSVFMELNLAAWDAFLNCPDRDVLKEALGWSDLSMRLETNIQYLDTRANLLYKLGRSNEAIDQEKLAIAMSESIAKTNGTEKGPFMDEFVATKEKMENKQPTWPTK